MIEMSLSTVVVCFLHTESGPPSTIFSPPSLHRR
jgi:hypothetical protein